MCLPFAPYYLDYVKTQGVRALEHLRLITHLNRPIAFVWDLPNPTKVDERRVLVLSLIDPDAEVLYRRSISKIGLLPFMEDETSHDLKSNLDSFMTIHTNLR